MAGQTRINGNLIDTGTDPEDIVSISTGDARYPKLDGPNTLSGDLDVVGNVNGRDIASDGSKLDTIESGADVTDTANVTAAGAVMDSELTNESAVKNIDQELTTTSSVDFGGLDVDSGTLFVDSANGRVGVGTSSPTAQFSLFQEAEFRSLDFETNINSLPTASRAPLIFTTDGQGTGFFDNFGGLGISARTEDTRSSKIALFTSLKERLNVDNNGNISFYEDTGTTPKFFWDASAEQLDVDGVYKSNISGSINGIHYTNYPFSSQGASVAQVIRLLPISDGFGGKRIYGRISGNRSTNAGVHSSAIIIDFVAGRSDDTTDANITAAMNVYSSQEGEGAFDLVSFDADGETWLGITMNTGGFRHPSTWFFDGKIADDNFLKTYRLDSVSNVQAFRNGGNSKEIQSGGKVFVGDFNVSGSLSKNSGSFKIDHPLREKSETHHLVHSFVESPLADNIYRGTATLTDGAAQVNIDAYVGMTEGTFSALNGNPQIFLQNESGFEPVKGHVTDNILHIQCRDETATDIISWMVVAERQDQHMLDTEWTDEFGRPILEPEKNPEPDEEPESDGEVIEE